MQGNTSQADLDVVFNSLEDILKDYDEKDIMPFESHDVHHPFGVGIYTSDDLKNDNIRIGSIVYHPVHTAKDKLILKHKYEEEMSTPNKVLESISRHLCYRDQDFHAVLDYKSLDEKDPSDLRKKQALEQTYKEAIEQDKKHPQTIRDMLHKLQISLPEDNHFYKFMKTNKPSISKDASVYEYTALVQKYIKNILPKKYIRQAKK